MLVDQLVYQQIMAHSKCVLLESLFTKRLLADVWV